MRIFDSKTSKGFTLLEVLVVISIMAILTGMVVLGFTGADQSQRQHTIVEQLQQRLELARQRSLQRNATWGVRIEANRYAFAEYDFVNALWVEQVERPFKPVPIPDPLQLSVEVEGETLIKGDTSDEDLPPPEVLLFASGEVTPFTIQILNEANGTEWRLASDGLSFTQLVDESGAGTL